MSTALTPAAERSLTASGRYNEARRRVTFCGYCATRFEGIAADPGSRVCPVCTMGLLVQAAKDVVPHPDQAFVLVDEGLAVCGLSRRAERVLRINETMAVGRHVADLLADVQAAADIEPGRSFMDALAAAVHGQARTEVALRPRRTSGARWWARIVPCEPRPAAMIVLTERL
jgi:hypothetical protein